MNSKNIKKSIVSLGLAGLFLISAGFVSNVSAQSWRRDRWEERREERREDWRNRERREEWREHERREEFRDFRYNRPLNGYYDRFGFFHPYAVRGYYERLGFFHRY